MDKEEIFLGDWKRMLYQEASGEFTVYKNSSPKPGLPILSKGDKSIQKILKVNNAVMVCGRCGKLLLYTTHQNPALFVTMITGSRQCRN